MAQGVWYNPLANIPILGGIAFADAAPAVTTNKLYNVGGTLYFNGSAVASAAATWTRTGTVVSPYNVADSVAIASVLTGAAADPSLNITQSWAAVTGTPTLTAIKLNVTDGTTNAASKLVDFQTGGTSQFYITKAGIVVFGVDGSKTATVIRGAASGATQGIYIRSGRFAIADASGYFETTDTYTQLGNGAGLFYLGTALDDTSKLILVAGAASLQLGKTIAAPVAQTFQIGSVITGTSNTAGVDFTINGSQGTGTGAGGAIIFKTAPLGSSGSTPNALAEAFRIGADGVITINTTGKYHANDPLIRFNAAYSFGIPLLDANSIGMSSISSNFVAIKLCCSGLDTGGVTVHSQHGFGWGSDDAVAARDTFLLRPAAATVQLGLNVNGSPVTQTLKSHNGITGSDVAGSDFIIEAGKGLGAGTTGKLYFKTATPVGTGTGAQSYYTRLTLDNNGALFGYAVAFPYRGITALRTLDTSDYFVDCTANSFAVTLPTAVDIAGRVYIIKNSGTGTITIDTTSSQTIDGETSLLLAVQYQAIKVMSDGANWKVV